MYSKFEWFCISQRLEFVLLLNYVDLGRLEVCLVAAITKVTAEAMYNKGTDI